VPVSVQQVIEIMEQWAPRRFAAEWDNVGLIIGEPAGRVEGVLVALDLTMEVAREAKDKGVQLIVTHHPPVFRPMASIRFDTPQGALVQFLIRHGIAAYASHTNLDSAEGGVSDLLAEALGLSQVEVLSADYREKMVKLVVFVPAGHLVEVQRALGEAGAGWIGNYSHCSFRTLGTGAFLPLAGAAPFIGQAGVLEEVEEYRLETIVPQNILPKVIKAMLKAHPYEEVAYDLYPLANEGLVTGLGRIGRLASPVMLEDFARQVKERLGLSGIRVQGDLRRKVSKVALCGGSGAGLIAKAVFRGADVLVTGDVKHHEALDACNAGLAIVDAGHYATEWMVVPAIAHRLGQELTTEGVVIHTSSIKTDPWVFI